MIHDFSFITATKMASNSGGVEWSSIVKPILAASYGSFNKNDVLELVKAINRR
jgi:E3 ubiquitin-protein ligase UBR4